MELAAFMLHSAAGAPGHRVREQKLIQKTEMSPVGHYLTLAAAREAALALAARELAHEIDRAGEGWVLLVEEECREEALAELAQFEAEQRERPATPAAREFGEFRPWSLLAVAAILVLVFIGEDRAPVDLTSAGDADAQAIMQHGAWWRCFTALTLHGDLSHLGANLMTGALFAGFLLPQFGDGATWLLVLLSGALGNWLNSYGYRDAPHHSIGASTAVFGALGMLVAAEAMARWQARERSRWQMIVPLGGGLALLAFLGVGEKHENIDFMAHFWGFCSGLALGLPAAAWRLREKLGRGAQQLAALAAVALLALAWWRALNGAG